MAMAEDVDKESQCTAITKSKEARRRAHPTPSWGTLVVSTATAESTTAHAQREEKRITVKIAASVAITGSGTGSS